jgi:hypothetical protein
MTKTCKLCKQSKKFIYFHKNNLSKDKLDNRCKKCKLEISRLPDIHFKTCYSSTKRRIKLCSTYKDKEHCLTWQEFQILKPQYLLLHKKWKDSNYIKKLVPTIDRIDNKIGYLAGNIQVLTKSENTKKDQLGHDNPSAKLKPYEVLAIKALKFVNPSITNVKLAKMFNTSRTNITLITTGKRWRHLQITDLNQSSLG